MSADHRPAADRDAPADPTHDGACTGPGRADASLPGTHCHVGGIQPEVPRRLAAEPVESLEHWYLCGDGSACRSS